MAAKERLDSERTRIYKERDCISKQHKRVTVDKRSLRRICRTKMGREGRQR